MNCAIMGSLNGSSDRIAFDMEAVERVLNLDTAPLVLSHDEKGLLLEMDDRVCRVEGKAEGGELGSYFIVLHSKKAFNVKDYKVLFHLERLPEERVVGVDESGKTHLCTLYSAGNGHGRSQDRERAEAAKAPLTGLSDALWGRAQVLELQQMIARLRQGEFFEALTNEFFGKIKEIAQELIAFRRDLQNKIEPGIVTLAEKEIPEASNQLEAINETLEKSTMKIMDIHEAQMEEATGCVERLRSLLGGTAGAGEHGARAPGKPGVRSDGLPRVCLEDAAGAARDVLRSLEKILSLNLRMTELLSFQDLVGQRIQKIIRLVKSMEARIEDLVISFGIKLKKYKEDPTRSLEDLNQEVREYKAELKGPQRSGEGMDQEAVDALLASL